MEDSLTPPPHPTPPRPRPLLSCSRFVPRNGRTRTNKEKKEKKKSNEKKTTSKEKEEEEERRLRLSKNATESFFSLFFLKRPIDFYGYYFFISLSAIDIAHFTIIPFTEIISTRIELRLLLFVSFFKLFLELHMMEEDVSVVIDCNRLAFH